MATKRSSQTPSYSSNTVDLSHRRFKLIEGNQDGTLDFGKQKHAVRVLEMSVCEFSAVADRSKSREIQVGKRAILNVLDREYCVEVREKIALDPQRDQLELVEIEEFDPMDQLSSSLSCPSLMTKLLGEDSLVHLVLVVASFITILVVPSFGGKWGSSQRISNAVESTWKYATSAFKR